MKAANKININMNGNTNNTTTGNTTTTTTTTRVQKTRQEYDDAIFDSKYSEYGFHHFQDPEYQRAFHLREEKYRLTFLLKKAFEGQEFLRKMRADMKREYLTRKRQMKKLQTDQAIVFRDAEMKLQEFYSDATGVPLETPRKIRSIDITSPLVTTFQLPFGNTLDLKELDTNEQFADLCEFHIKLRSDKEREFLQAELVQQEDEERECYFEEQAQQWRESRPWVAALSPQERWSYFLTHDEQEMIDEAQIAKVEYKRAREEENHPWMNSCRQTMERAAWVYKMKIFEMMTPEEREADLKECERQMQEYGRDTRYPTTYPEETDEETEEETEQETEEEKAERQEKETLRQMLRDEKDFKEMLEDDGLVVPQLNDAEAQDPKAFVTCSSAKSKPPSSASASASASAKKTTKARVAKQQKKKPKYIPFDIHSVENAKVTKEDVVVINLPKKILSALSREAMKRYNQKWNKKNALAKQSCARGARIPQLYDPRREYYNSCSDEE